MKITTVIISIYSFSILRMLTVSHVGVLPGEVSTCWLWLLLMRFFYLIVIIIVTHHTSADSFC